MGEGLIEQLVEVLGGDASAPGLRGVLLDHANRGMLVDGQAVALTRLEFGVLELLMERRDQVVTRTELLESVWQQQVSGSNVVDAVIKSGRKKMADRQSAIETGFGHGVMFGA
jgi:DNA-binding response OmpR family regulator